MTHTDPEIQAHKEWIGFVKPIGLVVLPKALIEAQAQVDVRAAMVPQQTLIGLTQNERRRLSDFQRFTTDLLGWRAGDLKTGDEIADLPVALPEFGDSLTPSYAVRDAEHPDEWLLMIQEIVAGESLDDDDVNALRGWKASHQARFERLLRERNVPIGILTNREVIRLLHAPRGESTGHATFVIQQMTEVAGRAILAALLMLVGDQRLFSLPTSQRLSAILKQSRRYQSEVSEALAGQVLESLWMLLYGFQAADEFSRGELLRDVLAKSPDDVYGGLLTTIMRLVFVLYAEDRGLLPVDTSLYASHYSLLGLFERLREDNARYPDTMTQRFGAWPQMLTLFRLLHDGASHGAFRLPPRHGRLFDPNVYPFLEGRNGAGSAAAIPRISDGTVYGILDRLLYLGGDRLSYAALDVEEIGSVYQAMMGFHLEIATGPSIGVKPKTKKGIRADVIVDLRSLIDAKASERAKLLKDAAGNDVTGRSLDALKSAATPEQVVAALGNKISPYTPRIIAEGAMVLQPTEERRRSGSHYTPRSLTQPIVRTTLQPILDHLCGDPDCVAFAARNDPNRDSVPGCIGGSDGERTHRHPRPEQILDLKVCDPAMGSGAFLVEACRFLGDALVRSWQIYGGVPAIPPDEDIVLYARRRIAQQCLYGVDRNRFAVDLSKLSLWLATLAKDHPFTFLDHALRHGDSLVGLTREQITHFDWKDAEQSVIELTDPLKKALATAEERRDEIHELGDSDDTGRKEQLLAEADAATRVVRTAGDLLVAAFFAGAKERERRALRVAALDRMQTALRSGQPIDDNEAIELRRGENPVPPFHWFLEFPEVFSRPNSGFDALIGNPPFAGKNTLSASNRDAYPDWLKTLHEETHGNADLVAQFFRRAFSLIRAGGTFGLIATNTIAQGDTRGTGLRWICKHGGAIYEARKRVRWPGSAAVIVSVVHVRKGGATVRPKLDGREVDRISAFLFHAGGDDDPLPLRENECKSFIGSYVLGMGFTFDDENEDATPIAEMHRLIEKNPRNADRIFPYIGGEEVNDSPTHAHRRYVINFGEMSGEEARAGWPDLMEIVEQKVKPSREQDNRASYRRYWWQFAEKRVDLDRTIRVMERVIVCARHQPRWAVAFMSTRIVFSEALVVFALPQYSAFAILQSNAHESWARLLGSSMKDDLRYTPSDCFETFPFPDRWLANEQLGTIGNTYEESRTLLMKRTGLGLTKIYNRFHDPDERHPDIEMLRRLHGAMDRVVLDAYGWTDLQPHCEFIRNYEDDKREENSSPSKTHHRYGWADEIRDEVLARLLALNAERAKQEALLGASTEGSLSTTRRTKATPLFGD